MIFSVCDDNIEGSLDFGPGSVTLTLKDLVHEIKTNSQEVPLAAWGLLQSQRQDFLHNHLAQFPITPNQEGTMEMRDEVLSSLSAQDLDNSGYRVCGLDDSEFYWANDELYVDAVFRPGIENPVSPKAFDN